MTMSLMYDDDEMWWVYDNIFRLWWWM